MTLFVPYGVDWRSHLRASQDRMLRAAKPAMVERHGAATVRAFVRHVVALNELARFLAEPIDPAERDHFEGRVRSEERDARQELERRGVVPLTLAEHREAKALGFWPSWGEEREQVRRGEERANPASSEAWYARRLAGTA